MRAHLSYLKYVLRHKWFVFLAGRKCGVGLWQLIIHDWTKFLPCEWPAYVRSFYNADGTKRDWKTRTAEDKASFDAAWNHHQKVNRHHWQYWVLTTDSDEPRTKPLPMDKKYLREMVADWVGAGRAITGKIEVKSWYLANKEKMLLHPKSRQDVEWILLDYFTP